MNLYTSFAKLGLLVTKAKPKTNLYNIALCAVIIASVAYIGFMAGTKRQTVKAEAYSESALATSIYPGSSASILHRDLMLINRAISQSGQDSQIVLSGLNYKAINGSSGELSQRITSLSLLINELSAVRMLSNKDKARLTAQAYSYMRPLVKQETDPWQAGSIAASLNNSKAGFVSFLQTTELLKVADDQQVAESLISQLGSTITDLIPMISSKGMSTADISADLTTMTSDGTLAGQISSATEKGLSSGDLNSKRLKAIDARLNTAGLDLSVAYKTAEQLINLIAST